MKFLNFTVKVSINFPREFSKTRAIFTNEKNFFECEKKNSSLSEKVAGEIGNLKK